MSFEKSFRQFRKNWRNGKYKRVVQSGGIGVAAICAVLLGRYYMESRQADEAMELLRQAKEEAAAEAGNEDGTGELSIGGKAVLAEYEDLFLENPDMVGWLTIDGTSIDYPVMWTPENPEFYSDKGFDKEESKNGLLFMDEYCDLDEIGGNIIIYGHNMKNGSMFADLLNYKKEKYWKLHPAVRLDTLYESRLYEIASVVATNDMDKLPYAYTSAEDSEAELALREMKKNALYDTGVDMEYGDDWLTLSTCDYSETDGRLVVMARRVK